MLDCELAQCYLSARLDGEITPEEDAALEAHLQDCPACRTLSEQLSILHQAMAELPLVTPPDHLKDTILSQIAAEPRRKRRWRPLLVSAAIFAIILMGSYGAYMLGTPSNSSGGTPQALAADFMQNSTAPKAEDAASYGGGGASSCAESADNSAESALRITGAGPQPAAAPAGGSETGQEKFSNSGGAPVPEAAEPHAYHSDSGSPQYYGVLTLSWSAAEPLLKDLPYLQEGNTRSYVLSAADFEALIQSLPPEDAVNLTYADKQAGQGLILVTDAPE